MVVPTLRSTGPKPLVPVPLVVEGGVEPGHGHVERLALAGLEFAAPALADRAKALDPFVAHGDALAPPPGDLELLMNVPGDLAYGSTRWL